MLRPKDVMFALIALMMGYVLVHNERFLIEPENPMWAHFSNYGWWIITHAMAGVAALFLAPFQFSDRLRQRYTNIHHIVGYVYVGGIFFLAPFGAYVQYIAEAIDGAPRSFTVLATVDAAGTEKAVVTTCPKPLVPTRTPRPL